MTTELRHRKFGDDEQEFAFNLPGQGTDGDRERTKVGVHELESLCTHHGSLEKMNSSLWMSILPCCVVEKWKPRYFMLVGSYLYRFQDSLSDRLKGTPTSIVNCSIRGLIHDPEGKHSDNDKYFIEPYCFELNMLRKRIVLKAANRDECDKWVSELNNRKNQAIREGLGHLPLNKTIKELNNYSKNLTDKRLQREIVEAENMIKEGNSMLGVGVGAGNNHMDTFNPMATRSSM